MRALRFLLPLLVALLAQASAFGSGGAVQLRAKATREQARNKLRYAAPVNLEESGKWRIDVTALHRGTCTETDGVIEVAPTPTLLMTISYWGYVAFLPLLIGAVVVHGWLIPRKR